TAPVAIEKAGHELLVKCIRMKLGEPDVSGRRRPVPVEGSEFEVNASSVISAIGQTVLSDCMADLGLEITRWGTIQTDPQTFMTSRPGIFACGDCQTGADTAVRAVGNGRKAAYAAHQYLLKEKVEGEPVRFNSSMGALNEISESVFEGYEKRRRIRMPLIPDIERSTTFREIETGFDPVEARKEAERCLKCGCEAADDCKLREYSTRYGAEQNLFKGERREYRLDKSHAKIKMEIHKCISCGSCVRACAEIKGLNVFSFVNRGFKTRMTAPFGRSLVDTACDGCGECVKVCPTAGVMGKKGVLLK
ncbi:MAG: FAD-dependent oxidoreductase, partial [Spirochaetota bacterium]